MKQRAVSILMLGLSVSLLTSTLSNATPSFKGELNREQIKNNKLELVNKEYNEYLKYIEDKKRKEEEEKQRLLKQKQLEEQKRREKERKAKVKVKITYNPYNLLEASNITKKDAYKMLKGTRLQTLSNAYVYMEQLYGVNAIYLMALSAEESGWGRSQLAITHNNIGGIKSGNRYKYFDNWYDCLNYKAKLLKNQYLTEGGSYFNGYSIWNVNEKYCEQKTWSNNINSIAYGLLNKLK